MDAASLKARHRQVRDGQSESLRVRIHRAISWLARAEREDDDPDARFIFLWIAFNAAYASEFGFEKKEREQADDFIERLLVLDVRGRLHQALFGQFSGPIRTLIGNRFVYRPFWQAVRDHASDNAWKERFEASRRRAMHALMQNETAVLVSIVLGRLYVLRNQLLHGGSTWGGATNRAQVRDGVSIMGTIVPIIIELMMSEAGFEFDEIAYPVI